MFLGPSVGMTQAGNTQELPLGFGPQWGCWVAFQGPWVSLDLGEGDGQVMSGLGVGTEGPQGEGRLRQKGSQEEALLLEEAFVFLTPSCRSGRRAEMGFLQG